MKSWKLPLVVLAIIVPIVAAFGLGGGGIGVAFGAVATAAIIIFAVRQRPHGPILPPPPSDLRRHILVAISIPVEEGDAVRQIAREANVEEDGQAEVLLLAPARGSFLDRWTSDLDSARRTAQRNLVLTVASLAKLDVAVEARVGDENLLQAVEDQLRSFPATEVILATGESDADPEGNAAAAELRERLEIEFRHLVLPGRAPSR